MTALRHAIHRRMHYAGALTVRSAKRVVSICAGWAACSTGPRAVAIRERGESTHNKAAVTCRACLSLIAKAEVQS